MHSDDHRYPYHESYVGPSTHDLLQVIYLGSDIVLTEILAELVVSSFLVCGKYPLISCFLLMLTDRILGLNCKNGWRSWVLN